MTEGTIITLRNLLALVSKGLIKVGNTVIHIMKLLSGYTLFRAIESSEKYRQVLHIMSSLGILSFLGVLTALLYRYATKLSDFITLCDNFSKLLTITLLYLTWVGALWVARETFDQKNIANNQVIESRKYFEYELGPYLRLQFMNKMNKDKNNIIKIKNNGRGSAIDVKFDLINITHGGAMNPIKIMTRPIMTPEGTSFVTAEELAKENETDTMQDNIDHMRTWLGTCIEVGALHIKCHYKDTVGNKYKATFIGDKTYFDGFRILEQGKE